MKLSVSNIAWPADSSHEAFAILRDAGISGIEVAPTKIWPEWEGATVAAAGHYRNVLLNEGFAVSSLQSIFYARPECTLFDSTAARRKSLAHIDRCADLAAALGAESMVFGSPRNRRRERQSIASVMPIAIDFFRRAAEISAMSGVHLCLEANPAIYGCDFVCTSAEAADIVRAVNLPGLRLHLDTGCMHLSDENAKYAIRINLQHLRHFHVSEPHLGTFDMPLVDHARAAETLIDHAYEHWIALEMRMTQDPLADLKTAVGYMTTVYGWRNALLPREVLCRQQQ